jgi:hypothetical protein
VSEAPPTIVAEPGSEDHEKLFVIVESFRAVLAGLCPDPREHMALGMAAGAILGGTLYAQAVACGIEPDARERRQQARRLMRRNFDSGITVGLTATARIMREHGQVQ